MFLKSSLLSPTTTLDPPFQPDMHATISGPKRNTIAYKWILFLSSVFVIFVFLNLSPQVEVVWYFVLQIRKPSEFSTLQTGKSLS